MSNIVLAKLGENIKASTAGQVATSSGPTTAPTLVDNTFSFRNKIINGNFDIWQRGTSFASPASTNYTADRWQFWKASGTVTSITQQSFTAGQTSVPNNPKYFLRMNVSVAGDIGISQAVEDVRTLAGKNVTVSFWVKASTNTTIQRVLLQQYFGTGGSPSPFVVTDMILDAAVTTSWTKITATVLLPNINGKTLGTDDNHCVYLRIDPSESFTGTFDISQVQLEEGSVATPFEQRPIGTELALCQRYFHIFSAYALDSYIILGGATCIDVVRFPVTMRTTPTITSGPITYVTNGGTPYSYFTANTPKQVLWFSTQTGQTAPGGFGAYNIGAKADAEL